MKITNLHDFLQIYFESHHCDLLYNQNGVLTIQLNEELDRALMNRPFYWHYMKNTGQKGEPMQLTLVTNPEKRDEKGEWIHFGSPRLQQIFKHLKQKSENIKLFQAVDTTFNVPLYPWLVTNIKISYEGKQNKEELFSIGLNLVNGTMKLDMMELLQDIPLHTTISDYCYPISPLIKINSGFIRVENVLDNYIKNQDHQWAAESMHTLHEEIQMVKHFFSEEEKDKLDKEVNELTKRYSPTISYHVINGGLVYLTEAF